MNSRTWAVVSTCLLVWAVFATWKWNLIASKYVSTSPLLANEAIADLERVVFLRQFADQYLNYDENSYWRNQTELTHLMSSSLREQRRQELALQRERHKTVNFRQGAKIVRLKKTAAGSYLLSGQLDGREGDRTWTLGFQIETRLDDVPRTLENPWGLEVHDLNLKTNKDPTDRTLALFLPPNMPTLVDFPCLVENVETPTGLPVRVKITSLRTSEIQLVRQGPLKDMQTMTALCHDQKFLLAISEQQDEADLFLKLDAAQGLTRVEKNKATKKNHEAYKKNLEQELGFVVEE